MRPRMVTVLVGAVLGLLVSAAAEPRARYIKPRGWKLK